MLKKTLIKILNGLVMILDDVLLAIGIFFIAFGVYLIHIPAGHIILGISFIALAYLVAQKKIGAPKNGGE